MTLDLKLSEEVATAQSRNQPIVALESTIITHGMPYPANVEMARQVEEDIRANGAVPATIAILKGQLCIGLEDADLSELAQAKNVRKVSRADFATTMAAGQTGATTVATTMIAANLAGIEVFATGGIGGVHRGAAQSFDISADLREFTLSPVNVIAAGAKAILDIPKTLEVLETLGVPVITYAQDDFPAFWARSSGLPSPLRMNSAVEIAAAFLIRRDLGLSGGQLIANPIPGGDEIPMSEMMPIIEAALTKATSQNVQQKEVTPFLLAEIFAATEGRSLVANIALVRSNARLAAEIAVEISKARR